MGLDSLVLANIVIATANLVLIIFYYLQLRETRKGILITELTDTLGFAGEERFSKGFPRYLQISNISNNKIRNLKVFWEFSFKGHKMRSMKTLDYLNPHEKCILPRTIGYILEKYPELFEEHKNTNSKGEMEYSLMIPKENLKIKLDIYFKWNVFEKQKDEYEIEWRSFKSTPELSYHPLIFSQNIRNGINIEKIKSDNGRGK